MKNKPSFILKVSCPGRSGIVAALGSFLAERSCFIKELHQYDDLDFGRFFCTIEFFFEGSQKPRVEQLRAAFEMTAMGFDMEWEIYDASQPTKVLIMVSKYDHCLSDLLYRLSTGELNIDITAGVSNHADLKVLADQEDVPYIHHSFLPGFKGARPYHQAYERGVKLIGATAHYVTADLDEGPIIEQMVERVSHSHDAQHLTLVGRDTEAQTLSRAVKNHVRHRVSLNGLRTVVF